MKLFGPAYSELQYNYNGLMNLYRQTGQGRKHAEYVQKKVEWEKLQALKEEAPEAGGVEMHHLSVKEIVNYVIM